MFHPDDLEHAFGVYLGAMQSGDDFSFEYRIKGADGILRWHMCQGRAHYGEDGQVRPLLLPRPRPSRSRTR